MFNKPKFPAENKGNELARKERVEPMDPVQIEATLRSILNLGPEFDIKFVTEKGWAGPDYRLIVETDKIDFPEMVGRKEKDGSITYDWANEADRKKDEIAHKLRDMVAAKFPDFSVATSGGSKFDEKTGRNTSGTRLMIYLSSNPKTKEIGDTKKIE
jgi:hypothetical protein